MISHWRNKRTNPTSFIPLSSFGNAFSHAIQANQSRGLVRSIEMHFRSGQICRVQSRPVFPFRLVVSFSPGPVKSCRPDEPGHPFQPTATSLRTLLRRQPFPYPRRLHNCQEICPGLLAFRTSFNSMVFACARCRRNCWLATIFHRMFSRLASHYATNAQQIGCTVQLNPCLLQLQARYR